MAPITRKPSRLPLPNETLLAEYLWDRDGTFSRTALQQVAERHLPELFRGDWVTDMIELVERLEAEGTPRRQIARAIVRHMNDDEEADVETPSAPQTMLAFPRLVVENAPS